MFRQQILDHIKSIIYLYLDVVLFCIVFQELPRSCFGYLQGIAGAILVRIVQDIFYFFLICCVIRRPGVFQESLNFVVDYVVPFTQVL